MSEFIDRINAENKPSGPESHGHPATHSATGDDPAPIPDPIAFLIHRVNSVIEESPQMGTEPLSTKAAVLAALYQAQALREISNYLHCISGNLSDIDTWGQRITVALESVIEAADDVPYGPAIRTMGI